MSELMSQLGHLLLNAIPTGVLLSVVWCGYRLIVHGKLIAVLSERRERTEGAAEKARADISAAEARSAEYEQRIRDIKLAIYKTKELRRRQQLEAHTAELAEARKAADARVQSGREALQAEVARAKAGLQPNVNSLVNQIIRTVLKSAPETTVAGR
jgi:F-type H+-transporting ATPase subunit b